MTYHNALMTQLTSLVTNVGSLRKKLKDVDETVMKVIFSDGMVNITGINLILS